jgi:hypothetical protein
LGADVTVFVSALSRAAVFASILHRGGVFASRQNRVLFQPEHATTGYTHEVRELVTFKACCLADGSNALSIEFELRRRKSIGSGGREVQLAGRATPDAFR